MAGFWKLHIKERALGNVKGELAKHRKRVERTLLANAQSTLATLSEKKSEIKASLQQTDDIVEKRQAGQSLTLYPLQQNVELLVRSLKAPLKVVHKAISQVKFVRGILRRSQG